MIKRERGPSLVRFEGVAWLHADLQWLVAVEYQSFWGTPASPPESLVSYQVPHGRSGDNMTVRTCRLAVVAIENHSGEPLQAPECLVSYQVPHTYFAHLVLMDVRSR